MFKPIRVEIQEVIKFAEQGFSEAILCSDGDGKQYYVKGAQSGIQARIVEWICANLANHLGLPIAPYALSHVPSVLFNVIRHTDLGRIGPTPGFASQAVKFTKFVDESDRHSFNSDLSLKIMVFDWWIHNMDRTVSNSNLLYGASSKSLTVIDHNLAFDREFDPKEFVNNHIFSHEWGRIYGDRLLQIAYEDMLKSAMSAFHEAVASMPSEWRYYDSEETMPTDDLIVEYEAVLARCLENDFWKY